MLGSRRPNVSPVVRLSRRKACGNTMLDVYFDEIELRPGVNISDYLVVESKRRAAADQLVTGVAVLPIYQGKIGLLGIFRPTMAIAGWEIARGFADDGETPEAAARRELIEETGLTCADGDLLSLGTICQEPGILNARTALFFARNCRPGQPTEREEPGLGDLRYFNPGEVADMAAKSTIEDACTLIAFYRYQSVLAA